MQSQTLPIHSIRIGRRCRRDFGDIASLARSIADHGLLQPPLVSAKDHMLIAGARRIQACKKLHWKTIPVHLIEITDALHAKLAQRDENMLRKDFTVEEKIAFAAEIETLARNQARDRQRASQVQNRRRNAHGKVLPGASKFDAPATSGRSDVIAAQAVNMSKDTYRKAKEVIQEAKRDPQMYGPLLDKMNATGKIAGVHRRLLVAKQAHSVNAEPRPLPTGPFRVIVADPPWHYDARTDPSHNGATPYATMTLDEIKSIPVRDIAHDHALLWLWTTNAHMHDAFHILESWEFEHKTMLTWIKNRMGTGDWLRGKSEHCLLAVHGRPTVTLTNQSTVLQASVGKHSQKPDAFYTLVESLCPGSKIELFARKSRRGWQQWGFELPFAS